MPPRVVWISFTPVKGLVTAPGGISGTGNTVIVENNSRGDLIAFTGTSVPIINKRKAETQVLVREGDRLVIGGVTQNVQQKTVRKVPLMGDIPVLGWLFKQREDFETGRELVVFLTPSILRTDGAQPAVSGR